MIPNYQEKMRFISAIQLGNCAIARNEGVVAQITELHHRLHDTKENRKKFPLFINSCLNLLGVNHDKHMVRGSFGKITDLQAEDIETVLRLNPILEQFVNNPQFFNRATIKSYYTVIKELNLSLKERQDGRL